MISNSPFANCFSLLLIFATNLGVYGFSFEFLAFVKEFFIFCLLSNHLIIDSEFPKSKSSIANIIRKHFDSPDWDSCFQTDEQKEQAIQAFANQPYSSVRALENTVISFLASVKGKKVNLRNGDIGALIKEFVENIDSPALAAI